MKIIDSGVVELPKVLQTSSNTLGSFISINTHADANKKEVKGKENTLLKFSTVKIPVEDLFPSLLIPNIPKVQKIVVFAM